MKIPATFEEQMEILKNLWFIINDEEKAINYLKHIWFYRFSHYFTYFIENHNWEEFSFENILKYYIFDRKLKLILSDIIERIEVSLKANIINLLSLKYNDAIFFINEEIYLDQEKYTLALNSLEIEKNKNKSFKNIDLKNITSWKLFQWLTLWSTTFFYSSLNTQNQKLIADTYNLTNMTLLSWILWLTDLRNICAHYDKFWWIKMTRYLSFKHPKIKNINIETNSIFAYVLIMHIFLKEIWIDSHFLDKIEKLFNEEEYKSINKEKMWFNKNWRNEIEKIYLNN